jgi:4-diphosphocytidyl-2-C-methyl-D-erythritol kinase
LTSSAVTLLAPAKLNLFLHVLGRRQDGYHDIQTLFQLIDLADELRIETTHSAEIFRYGDCYGVEPADDLVVKAAALLQESTGTRQGARIGVRKNIPLGAGLGGGSSDAAATLTGLNKLWCTGLSQPELAQLALELGADVPVFIYGRSALGAGIGEKLQFVNLGERHYVLVFNPMHVSTAEVFNNAALPRGSLPISLPEALAGAGRNDCEAVVCQLYPAFRETIVELEKWGQPRMTGTGSCIFLAMPDKKAAVTAAREIKCRYTVRTVRGLDVSPLHAMLNVAPGRS